MTRLFTTTILASILLTNSLVAQERRSSSLDNDPIATTTARIMSQFFPSRDRHASARSLDEHTVNEHPEPLPWWGIPMLDVPSLWSVPERMPRRTVETGSWMSMARSMSSMARKPHQENAPTAFSSAFANGNYAIEAIVPTEMGPEKVRLDGTRSEVEEQFRSLPLEVRRSLGPNLGM